MLDIKKIKERINCLQYCKQSGIPGIDREGARCVSPLRSGASNPTSFECWKDSWKDWGADLYGDVIDLCALHKFGGDKGEAIRYLAMLTGVDDDGSGSEWRDYTQQLCNQIAFYHEQLPDDYRAYMHSRGITDETINRLRIGKITDGSLQGRLCIPYYKNGYVAYFISRSMPGSAHEDVKYMKMKVDDFNDHCPWGLHTLERDPERNIAIIAEGAFDVMSFEQESANGKNWACLSAITGNFSRSQLQIVLPILRSYKQTYIIYDNDGAGRTAPGGAGEKFSQKMSRLLFKNNIPFRVCHCPRGYKDVSEYYADGGDLQVLLDESVDGALALAKTYGISQTKELAALCRSGCRYKRKPEVAELFAELVKLDRWPAEFLKALKQECTSAPSEDYISDEVCRKHKLLYNDRIGMKEYNDSYWEDVSEAQLHSYIDKELGVFSTGGRISGIAKLVRARCVTRSMFDIKPVFNFVNGTLELKPEIRFREHSADDLCTYCAPYPFNETARCNEWEHFIETVTDGDDRKMALLQEVAGYVLQDTNKMQAAVFLIGEGSNGKSVYTDTLKAVYTQERTTAVRLEKLDKDFQLVQMSTSILNVCGETDGEIDSSTSTFKSVVAGDLLNACYKGRDFFSFIPRTKFFINCNSFPRTSDTSNGFLRRCVFIEFPLNFVMDREPTRLNERRADTSLSAKLQTPEALSGIFSWCLEGYKTLESVGYFTKTDEAEDLKERFKETLNPLIVFIRDCPPPLEISLRELYLSYTVWCEDCNHRMMSRTAFSQKIKPVIKEYLPDYEEFRSSKSRLNWRKK